MPVNCSCKERDPAFPLPFRRWPPAAGEAMLQGLLTGQLEGYVPDWGQDGWNI